MSTNYRVTFERIGRNRHVPDLVTAATDHNDLAEQIYRYAGRFLGSRCYTVDTEDDKGWIEGGRFGQFTIAIEHGGER